MAPERQNCTPADLQPPPVPRDRVAVLVSGTGSNSKRDDVQDVDPVALGYETWSRFSYNGGSTADNEYTGRDTTTDMRTRAKRLRELLDRIARENPARPST